MDVSEKYSCMQWQIQTVNISIFTVEENSKKKEWEKCRARPWPHRTEIEKENPSKNEQRIKKLRRIEKRTKN